MNQKGITLIALVITIIILLILAGVTLNMVLGDDGIIAQAQKAKEMYNNSETLEIIGMDLAVEKIESIAGKGTTSDSDLANSLKEKLGADDIKVTRRDKDEEIEDGNIKDEEIYVEIWKDDEYKIYKVSSDGKVTGPSNEYVLEKFGLEIGDVVNYNCYEGVSDSELTYEKNKDVNPSLYPRIYNAKVTKNNGLEWKVMGTEDGKVLLVSNGAVSLKTMDYTLYLLGRPSHRLALNEMQNIANIYSHGKGAASARFLNMDDIDKLQQTNPEEVIWGKGEMYEYGKSITITLKFDETQQKKYLEYKAKDGNTAKTYIDSDYTYFDENSNTFKILEVGKSITIKNTYYGYNPIDNTSVNIPELLALNDTSESLWLATRVSMISDGQGYYGFDIIKYENSNWRTSRITLAYGYPTSDGIIESGANLGFRVVVALDEKVSIEESKTKPGTYDIKIN